MIVEKPWGTYEILLDVPERGYKVKRIVVYPYQRFSLQYHKKRTEHWSIVSGTGTIFIETQIGECDEDDIIRLEDDYGRVKSE